MKLLGHTKTLLWKNLLIKSRSPLYSLFELVLPVLPLILIAYIASRGETTHNDEEMGLQYNYDHTHASIIMRMAHVMTYYDTGSAIAFAPPHPLANTLKSYLIANSVNFSVPLTESNFIDFDDEKTLVDYINDDSKSSSSPVIAAGVVFNDVAAPDVSYSLRMYTSYSSYEMRSPSTSLIAYNRFQQGMDSSGFLDYNAAAVPLQLLLDEIVLHSLGASDIDLASMTAAEVDERIRVRLQAFPAAAFDSNVVATIAAALLQLSLLLAYLFPIRNIVAALVEEKELKLRAGLQMMGMSAPAFYLSWATLYAAALLASGAVSVVLIILFLATHGGGGFAALYYALFVPAIVAFSCCLSTLFSRTRSASTATSTILVVFYLFGMLADYLPEAMRGIVCLSPISALSQGLSLIITTNARSAAFSPTTSDTLGFVAPAVVLAMLVLDILLYGLLTVYLDQVLPAEDKVTKPWYFPLAACRSLCRGPDSDLLLHGVNGASDDVYSNLDSSMDTTLLDEPPTGPTFEPPAAGMAGRVGVRTRGLRKEFSTETGTLVAVKGLDLDMYKGQIFGLLGHNGSGKTTAIHMLTGLYGPTSGDAQIAGRSVLTEMESIYGMIGVCPQADALFPSLTVLEHMQLFARIKGLDHNDVTPLLALLDEVELGPRSPSPKQDAQTSALSGGQKRKLSLALALLGEPAVVFLDEPTSGMDVAAQRAVWALLMRMKQDRVIVLTTHSLEEAEIADRIGILQHGVMNCAGSPMFLKHAYNVGYTLSITKPDADAVAFDRVLTTVHAPTSATAKALNSVLTGAYPWVEFVQETPNEVCFRLPLDRSAEFAPLLRALDDKQPEIGFGQYGLSVRALTDVFMHSSRIDAGETAESKALAAANDDDALAQLWADMPVPTGFALFTSQMRALVTKRFHSGRRDLRSLFMMALYPCLLMLFFIWSLSGSNEPLRALDAQALYPSDHPFELAMEAGNPLADQFADALAAAYPGFDVRQLDGTADPDLFDVDLRQQMLLDSIGQYSVDHPRIGALSLVHRADAPAAPEIDAIIYTNSSAPDGAGAFVNAFSNARLRAHGSRARIHAAVHPLPSTFAHVMSIVTRVTLAFFLVVALCSFPGAMVTLVVKEKADQATHLQFISGVTPWAYWLSNFVADWVIFLMPWSLLLIVISASGSMVDADTPITDYALGMMLFFVAVAPFAYAFSFLCKKHTIASGMLMLVLLASVYVFGIIILIVMLNESGTTDTWIRVAAFSPSAGLVLLFLMGMPQIANSSATSITRADIILYLAIDVAVYWGLLFLVQLGEVHNVWARLGRYFITGDSVPRSPPVTEDSDVRAERERIESGACDDPSRFPLVVRGIRKVYPGNLVAVRNLHFAVPKGQVYGFLGSNGAGKSTAMSMLTGNLLPASTSGPAILNGTNIFKDPTAARRVIGYCPQFEALCPRLTAREHLYMYARIKGVTGARLENFVETLLTQLGLTQYADRAAGSFSMGTKRRLSVGLALVGDPSLVLLDEPSTGVDPASKLDMWNVIRKCMRHRSVILTSHSMEEVEALCSVICIMSRGEAQAIGSKQHLKHKFGRGYQIAIKTLPGFEAFVRDGMLANMPGLEAGEAHGCVLKFHIRRDIMRLADIFERVEQIKDIFVNVQRDNLPPGSDPSLTIVSGIDTYSVSETELDQVFIELMNRSNNA